LGEAGRGKGPAREKEIEIEWDPNQGCLVVETKQGLELGLSQFMFELSEGEVRVVGTDEVRQPELTITEMVFADSEPEARRFYEQNGSGVDVRAGSRPLLVTGKSSSDVVSGGSGNVQIDRRSGGVVVVNSYVRGNIFNRVNGGTGGTVIINGEQTGSSQSVSRGETQVVLRVPVANEGEQSEYNSYIIRVNSGNIRIESVTGKYTISADAGDIVVEACNMVDSKIENKAGKTKVAAATLNVSEIKNKSGEIEVIGAKLNSCSIAGKTKNIAVVGTILNSCAITNQAGNIEVTDGIFIGENAFNTRAGNISVKFGRGQGEIEVKASVGGHATQKLFFEGVENPNGQTARLSLTTQDGEIKVNE